MKDDLTNSLEEIRNLFEQWNKEYNTQADNLWNSLSEEDRLKCFYSVCKRIHKGDIEERGSYRYVLYDVFGFGPEAYTVGMSCGYMDIHNGLFTSKEGE